MTDSTKTVVYDWNGTLLDDATITHRCLNIVIHHFGFKPCSIDVFRDFYDIPIEKLYLGIGIPQADLHRLDKGFQNIFHDNYEPLAATAPLREGAREILTKGFEKGLKQHILSNHLIEPIKTQLDRLEIAAFFDQIMANESRQTQFNTGPKGHFLKTYIQEKGVSPSDIILVGDSPEEMNIAKELGLIGVALTGGYVSQARLEQSKPDYIIQSLNELDAILQERKFYE